MNRLEVRRCPTAGRAACGLLTFCALSPVLHGDFPLFAAGGPTSDLRSGDDSSGRVLVRRLCAVRELSGFRPAVHRRNRISAAVSPPASGRRRPFRAYRDSLRCRTSPTKVSSAWG